MPAEVDQAVYSASVVKATILGALLRKAQEQRRSLTGTETSPARAMITRSDNNAASALWARAGGSTSSAS